MKSNLVRLSRGEKLLIVLFELSGKSNKSVRYEDIVVDAFKRFPDDFHLKGYPQYPESGDLVHKPLYDFKKKGLLVAGNKMFALTEKGLTAAEYVSNAISGHNIVKTERVTRDIEKEVSRISRTVGFNLYAKGDKDSIVDTDFYDYLSATVRSTRSDFLGRLNTLNDLVKNTSDMNEPVYKVIAKYHSFMTEKFKDIIDYKKEHMNG